ncbi:MAG: Carboxypeptidase regulatory-like domain [Thermoplasmata archaeon]|jgi:hypothetical protein|nr:Carboxypeptidase regulatory-like domain [Thermoplasmata archaeon]
MRTALLLAVLLLAPALAGCGGKGGGTGTETGKPALQEGKGAIAGLVIDDVYRPVPKALILVEKLGLTATSDGEGQFNFAGLEPGAYILKVQADGHATGPRTVQVVAGQYTEVEVQADRLFNAGSRIVTTEYTIFMTCTIDAVAVSGNGLNCLQDQSGDSERTLFSSNLTRDGNVTAMVTEITFNQKGNYAFDIAIDDDGDSLLDRYWAERDIADDTYGRIVLRAGEANTDANAGRRNIPWEPLKEGFSTTVFVHGLAYSEVHNATTVGPLHGTYSLGASFGIRGKIVQSVFLGEPAVDLATYAVLKS